MIAFIRGLVAEKGQTDVVIDVNGLGYRVFVANETHSALENNQEAQLVIYEHIKEDAHDLYGFIDISTKELFELLLSVNGVGPKMALNIMNVAKSSDLRQAIASGDTKLIQAASGVGKKVAERVVVDLKDKVGLVAGEDATDFLGQVGSSDEAVQALTSLGFTMQDATAVLRSIDPKLPLEERIKMALKTKG